MSNLVRIIPVDDLIKTRNNKSKQLQSTEYLKNGILPIVDQSSKLICGYTNDLTKSYDAGLPVVVFGDHTLHTKYIDFNFAVGADGTQVIVPKHAETDTKYLYYLIARATEIIGSQGYKRHFSILKQYNTEYIESTQKQQKIAAILSSVDDVIEKTREQIDKLKDLKTGMMQELLTKGIGHTEFKDSPVGTIPTRWKYCELSTVVNAIVDCEHKTAPYVERSKYLVVRTSNVRGGELILDDMKYTNSEAYQAWTQRAAPQAGDILFTREAPAGESCLVPKNLKICMGQRMVLLRPDRNKVLPDFLSLFLSTDLAKLAIYDLSIGTTVTRINIEDIRKIPCLVPPLDEQEKISHHINSTSNALTKKRQRLDQLELIKKALMQDLLTGKVRVNVEEKEPAVA